MRSDRALIQTIGRTARNVNSKAILYADKITDSMKRAMAENSRNRAKQQAYNEQYGIKPKQVKRGLNNRMPQPYDTTDTKDNTTVSENKSPYNKPKDLGKQIKQLEKLMQQAARELNFLDAAMYRDKINELKK